MNDILQYKGYYADISFSAQDEVFYGKLIGINDLVNFEADSVKALVKAFHEAVEDYLETCAEIGKAPEKTYKGSLIYAFRQNFIEKLLFSLLLKK